MWQMAKERGRETGVGDKQRESEGRKTALEMQFNWGGQLLLSTAILRFNELQEERKPREFLIERRFQRRTRRMATRFFPMANLCLGRGQRNDITVREFM